MILRKLRRMPSNDVAGVHIIARPSPAFLQSAKIRRRRSKARTGYAAFRRQAGVLKTSTRPTLNLLLLSLLLLILSSSSSFSFSSSSSTIQYELSHYRVVILRSRFQCLFAMTFPPGVPDGGGVVVRAVHAAAAERAVPGVRGDVHPVRVPRHVRARGARVLPPRRHQQRHRDPGRGGVENTHSTDFESPPPPPRVCTSIHPELESCSDLGSSACSRRPSCQGDLNKILYLGRRPVPKAAKDIGVWYYFLKLFTVIGKAWSPTVCS